VGLSFSDIPEKLEVPFAAVRGFYDPSVNFELEFDVPVPAPAQNAPEAPVATLQPAPAAPAPAREAPVAETKEPSAEEPKETGKGADVVSLDAFRKK